MRINSSSNSLPLPEAPSINCSCHPLIFRINLPVDAFLQFLSVVWQMGVSSNRVESFSNCQDLETSLPTAAAMEPLEIHKVCLPPSTTTFKALKGRFSEIFFPDDPLNQFKNQPFARKLVLGLTYFFPIFHWAPEYNLTLLKSDVISGITIASLSIPQVRRWGWSLWDFSFWEEIFLQVMLSLNLVVFFINEMDQENCFELGSYCRFCFFCFSARASDLSLLIDSGRKLLGLVFAPFSCLLFLRGS